MTLDIFGVCDSDVFIPWIVSLSLEQSEAPNTHPQLENIQGNMMDLTQTMLDLYLM